ncbi:MAG: GNAT family N-acetyltransferase, partial [Oscillospiraceae bacterium]|nr:GNAT family N-acetyltransferase [Oscillospiraceae bacterium]
RIASSGTVPGTGRFCLDWAYAQAKHLRIDTHPDNRVMQRLLERCGFRRTGIIHVVEDNDPRLAYERTGVPL